MLGVRDGVWRRGINCQCKLVLVDKSNAAAIWGWLVDAGGCLVGRNARRAKCRIINKMA